MSLEIIKFESSERWAVLDTTIGAMLHPVLDEELVALLFVACVEFDALGGNEREQSRYISYLGVWLDEVAPRRGGRWSDGPREIPAAWARALVDTSFWDEEALALPVELQEYELIELLGDPKRGRDVARYLCMEFREWKPKPRAAR